MKKGLNFPNVNLDIHFNDHYYQEIRVNVCLNWELTHFWSKIFALFTLHTKNIFWRVDTALNT